jgi:hypothetical protein
MAHDFKLYDWNTLMRKKRPLNCDITDKDRNNVIRYLTDLGLYGEYRTWGNEKGETFTGCFTLPWVNFLQTKHILEEVMRDSYFDGLSERDKKLVFERIFSDAMKDMITELLVLETQKAKGRDFKVCRLDSRQPCDMIVYDTRSDECWIYMVNCRKDLSEPREKQRLLEEEYRRFIERQFGRIIDRSILYMGDEKWAEQDIHYQNIGSYLSGLERKSVV